MEIKFSLLRNPCPPNQESKLDAWIQRKGLEQYTKYLFSDFCSGLPKAGKGVTRGKREVSSFHASVPLLFSAFKEHLPLLNRRGHCQTHGSSAPRPPPRPCPGRDGRRACVGAQYKYIPGGSHWTESGCGHRGPWRVRTTSGGRAASSTTYS